MLGMSACSENLDNSLEPTKTERTLNLTLNGTELPDRTLSLGAAPSTTKVDITSNTRWTVEITGCQGGWCNVDVINGTGDGSFTISVLDNMKDKRDCYVTVYKIDAQGEKDIDGSREIKVVQAVSDVRMTPSSLAPFAPQNNERQKFEIVSNVDWSLYVTYEGENATDFVTITPDTGTMTDKGDGTFAGDGEATFYMSLANNRTAADRKAYINLKSEVATYSVEITQLKSQFTFDVSPAENQIVPAEGGTINYGILSLSDWKVSTAADWIRFSLASGSSSEERVTTVATIDPNPNGYERKAELHFKPTDSRFEELSITVTQRALEDAAKPAVSVPWLADGYGQSNATVEFNFYSPFKEIVEAGLQWRKEAEEEWQSLTLTPDNSTDCTVSFELTELAPATKYVARGFVKDAEGNITYGSVSYPFTTAGKYPGNGDNPTPTK